MNFFEQQDRAHRNTQKLVGLFILSVICIIVTVYGVAVIALAIAYKTRTPTIWWQPQLFWIVAAATILLIGSGTWFKLLALRQGGQVIAEDLGGRLLIPNTTDPTEQQLLNVVEEMAIASGISVPEVYILDREQGINAFAAGFTPNDAVIGVTRGCLELLNRDQLQGVIGHEFSHILNGDMRLNLRLVGLLHGILLIYLTGRILCDFRSRDRNNGIAAFGLGLIVVGAVGLFCGRLIKSAVSRQREFLADASAVQFTRNPSGIAGALRKIADHHGTSLVQSPYAEENSHLFFGSALRFDFLGELFATHPPLEQRIRRLESNPTKFAAPKSSASIENRQRPEIQDSLVMGLTATGKSPSKDAVKIPAPDQVMAQVGTVTPEQFTHAQALLAKLPPSIQTGVRDRHNAIAIVYALALNLENPQIQEKQLDWLRQVEPSEVVESTLEFNREITQLDPKIRLPLLDLTIPALRQSSATQCQQLFKCVTGLARANGQRSLADFVLYIVLWHRLQPCINATVENKIQYTALAQVWPDCLILLSALAQVGQTSQNEVAYAFRSGIYRLPGASQQALPETPPAFNLGQLHQSLKRLGLVSAKLKQKIVDACAYTVLLDNVVTGQEADLLRAIAITLDCPLPPFLKTNR